MAKIKFDKSFLVLFLALFASLSVYFFMAVRPGISKRRMIAAEIKEKREKLELFREEKKGALSAELIELLNLEREECQRKTALLKEYLGVFHITLPADVTQKGLFFKEKAYRSERQLRKEAESKGVILPASLGFDKGVPKEEDAEKLLWELSAVERVIEILIESGMEALLSLELKPAEKCSEAGIVYSRIPIEMRCQAETFSLLNFVYSLSRDISPLVIKKMEVEMKVKKDKEELEIALTVEGIRFD